MGENPYKISTILFLVAKNIEVFIILNVIKDNDPIFKANLFNPINPNKK